VTIVSATVTTQEELSGAATRSGCLPTEAGRRGQLGSGRKCLCQAFVLCAGHPWLIGLERDGWLCCSERFMRLGRRETLILSFDDLRRRELNPIRAIGSRGILIGRHSPPFRLSTRLNSSFHAASAFFSGEFRLSSHGGQASRVCVRSEMAPANPQLGKAAAIASSAAYHPRTSTKSTKPSGV
jgi:hypothetical protein